MAELRRIWPWLKKFSQVLMEIGILPLRGQALRKWVRCEFRYRFGNRVRNVRFAIGREDSLRIWVSLTEIADRAFVTQVGLVNNHILN